MQNVHENYHQKYTRLIDAETWAFIAATEACYPPGAEEQSMTGQRALYNAMCRKFHAGRPTGVSVYEDTNAALSASAPPVPVRIYQPQGHSPHAHLLYFHGGGFVVGDLDSHDDVCAEFCAHTGLLVTSVDYRLAPEHVYPAAFDDALASFQHATAGNKLPVILAGDSAGATLAASVAHRSRQGDIQPLGQLLIYPVIGSDFSQGTYLEHAHAPMLATEDMLFYQQMLLGGADIPDDPVFAPLNDVDFSGLPPTWVFTAECDPLAGDGKAYCEKIQAAGGVAHCSEETGLVHGYLRARHSVTRARASFARILAALGSLTLAQRGL